MKNNNILPKPINKRFSGSLEAGVRIILIAVFSGSLKTGEGKKNEQQVVASVRW
ncbi:hypothetical protein [Kingella oralis]|uniref:hypothetical protein n=1 Tax=Kingella oralis TaxID=505 RepID=UPI002D7F01DB|nr:hypothetical protein [Kingella oralis]